MEPQRLILIAEDDSVLRLIIVKQLSKLGLVGHVAENGPEAVVMATKIPYSLILMDVMMPKMDGMEATRRIREYELQHGQPLVPIVALTSTIDKQACLAAGMNDFLCKPITMEQLQDVITKWAPSALPHPQRTERLS